jgi:predicted CopG family antitoxin
MDKKQELVKLIRVSDKAYEKLQKIQKPRETYGQLVERITDYYLEKEHHHKGK